MDSCNISPATSRISFLSSAQKRQIGRSFPLPLAAPRHEFFYSLHTRRGCDLSKGRDMSWNDIHIRPQCVLVRPVDAAPCHSPICSGIVASLFLNEIPTRQTVYTHVRLRPSASTVLLIWVGSKMEQHGNHPLILGCRHGTRMKRQV